MIRGHFFLEQKISASAARGATVKTSSIDSNWAERDKHLRGENFLDVETFSEATFKGIKFTDGENGGTVEGAANAAWCRQGSHA